MPVERDTLEVDVLIVGAGPAGLTAALHLKHLAAARRLPVDSPSIAVLEKGAEIGAHSLSGAILNPATLQELLPETDLSTIPLAVPVGKDLFYFLTKKRALNLSFLPFLPQNRENWIISLNRMVRWLAEKAEEKGILLFPGFCGRELLFDGNRLAGVRTGDKGVSRDGTLKSNFEPGVDIRAKVTVLAEGAHGSLTEELLRHFALHREAPQSYSLGLKEVWELEEEPEKEGKVIHTIGFPLSVSAGGGGFLYCHGGMLSVGLVSPLAGANLALDPHEEFQRFKNHPFIARYLGKGRLAHAGAKIIPEGGFFSIPPVVVPGGLIVGDSAGLLNSLQLKGIHLAMKSGMLAADSIVEAWSGEGPVLESLHNFAQKLQESFIGKQLSAVRHFQHQMRNGVLPGLLKGTLHTLMGAHRPMGFPETKPVRRNTQKKAVGSRREPVPFDQRLSFDKATTLFYSGVRHEEDQPPHLLISDFSVCRERCTEEFGNPCRHFCPAEVFEVLEDPSSGQRYPRLLPSNCLHCKACEIADPYGIIRWIPPEGGGGPNYRNL